MIKLAGKNINPSKFKVYTNSTSLSDVSLDSSGSITLQNQLTSPSLNIAIDGSGSLSAEKIKCDQLNIAIGGSGSVKVGGSAAKSNIAIKGSGSINASDLTTKETNCAISGSGSAKVYTTDNLSVAINGSGSIKYKGTPKNISKIIKGSGGVSSF